MRTIVLPLLFAMPAFADCPPVADRTGDMDALIAEARGADTPAAGQEAGRKMWAIWTEAPDEIAQEMLDRGVSSLGSYDFLRAIEAFDDLTGYCPDYAEGYNQRAFAHFLREDYPAALIDIEHALDRNPRHVGALSGKALTLFRMGREEDGQAALRAALDLNPWLNERFLLKETPGTDL